MLYVDADNSLQPWGFTHGWGSLRSDCDAQYAAASVGNPHGVSGTLGT